jgi:hypothetical protein
VNNEDVEIGPETVEAPVVPFERLGASGPRTSQSKIIFSRFPLKATNMA